MTRKDYELIALTFKDALKLFAHADGMGFDRDDHYQMLGIYIAAARLADVLKLANPRFNRKKFFEACTITPTLDLYPNGLPEDLK